MWTSQQSLRRQAAPSVLGVSSRKFSEKVETVSLDSLDGFEMGPETRWSKWFPYEPRPVIPQYQPYVLYLSAKQTYMWCACGHSKTQPWYDKETCAPWCRPRAYTPKYDGWKSICACKHSNQRPIGDTTFVFVWADHNTPMAALYMFSTCFVGSVFMSWLCH